MSERRTNGKGSSGTPSPRHGTRSAYTQGCRCPDCTEAARAYVTAWRRARGVAERAKGRTHGRRATYAAGCRCDACRAVERDYRANRAPPPP